MTPFSSDAWPLAARAVGSVLAGCRIEAVLHVGPVFTVYRAGDALGGGRYALKEYAPQSLCLRDADGTPRLRDPSDAAAHTAFEAGRAACLEEWRLLARLRLPGLVPVLQASEEQACPCALMPLLPGGPLSRRDPPRGDDALRELLLALLEPLSQVHAAGLVHGGLHVDQVLWAPGQRPVLLGFGFAARALRLPLALQQSAPELRPEGAHLPRGPWTDLYALAATVLQHATGRAWDGAASVADIATALEAALPRPAGAGRPLLVQVLHACLRPSPTERPDGALALRALLGGGAGPGQPAAGGMASASPAGVPPPLRHAPGARAAGAPAASMPPPAAAGSAAMPPGGAKTPAAFAFMSPAQAVEKLRPAARVEPSGAGTGDTARGAGSGSANAAAMGPSAASPGAAAQGSGTAQGTTAAAPGLSAREGADGPADRPGSAGPSGGAGQGAAPARPGEGVPGAAPGMSAPGVGDGEAANPGASERATAAAFASSNAGLGADFTADAGLRAARPMSAPPRADGPSPRALAAGAAAALVLAVGVGLGAWWVHGLWQAEQEREHLGRLMAEAAAQASASAPAGGVLPRAGVGAGIAEDGPGVDAAAGAGRGPQAASGGVASTTGGGSTGASGGATASGAPGGAWSAAGSAPGLPRGAAGQAGTGATNAAGATGAAAQPGLSPHAAGVHATAPGGDGRQAASVPARRAPPPRREAEAGRGDTPAQSGAETDTLLASLPPTPLAACVSQAKSALERCMREQCAKDAWRSHALCRQPRERVE